MKRLAFTSAAMLIGAFIVAEPLGGLFAAAGMAGIFILRFRLATLFPLVGTRAPPMS